MAGQIESDAALDVSSEAQISIESDSSVQHHSDSHCKINDTEPTTECLGSPHLVLHR